MKGFGWEILTAALAICVLLGGIVRMILRTIDKKFNDLKEDMGKNLLAIDHRVENAAVDLKHRGEMVEKALQRMSLHISDTNLNMTILETRIQERNKIAMEKEEKQERRSYSRLRPTKDRKK